MDRYMWPPGVEPALKKGVYLASKVQVEACIKRLDPAADLTSLWQKHLWHIPAISKTVRATSASAGAQATNEKRKRAVHNYAQLDAGVNIDGLSPVKPEASGHRKRQKGPARASWETSETVPIEEVLSWWSPSIEQPIVSSLTFPNKGWYRLMQSESPGTLFVGQCVFLRPEQEDSAPFILLITELFPPNHPSGKTGAGYYFWRAEDIRVFSGVTDFSGSNEGSEVYVTKHRVEFEVDEVSDLTDVQPFFVGEDLDGLFYKSVWDYDSGLLKHIDFNLEGSATSPSSLPKLLRHLHAQAYRSNSQASEMLTELAFHLGEKLQSYVANKKVIRDKWVPECSVRGGMREVALLPPALLDCTTWNRKKACIQLRIDQKEQLVPLLGQDWWIKYAQTARVGGDMNSYEIHLPIVLELSPTGDMMKVRMHGLEMFNLAGASQWDTRCNPYAMKRVPK
ncbi:hypothetical protein KFL_003270120 [Klebsormidium nitens]|uniref:BAH domain-containing protein n=1 Tax=Klebsormidium nitens TaxID=105231 RepID=A0A1Y1I7V0_KLENI|nr:hypothetical protein KFL_003270120 [Klebsormidium nitens]|eukprot:GAQ87045.1 hypothetical protein KFL_003270120 [Klebsormidium nitens]